MKRYIAFLRGINVSGQKLIKMELLRDMFNRAGYANVVTYIQSGNVVFDTKGKTDKVRADIEKMLETEIGYRVATIVRTAEELLAVIAANPFTDIPEGHKLYITYLAAEPAAEAVANLPKVLQEGEQMQVIGREIYFTTAGYGNTKFTNAYIEKQLKTEATTRNLATTIKVTTL